MNFIDYEPSEGNRVFIAAIRMMDDSKRLYRMLANTHSEVTKELKLQLGGYNIRSIFVSEIKPTVITPQINTSLNK